MRYLCNLTTYITPYITPYITVEAATLIALTLAAATSYIMAKKRKSGTPKPPSTSGSAPGVNPAAVVAPVVQEVDTRPETSWVMSRPALLII